MMKPSYKTVISGLGNIAWRFDQKNTNGNFPLTHAGTIIRCSKTSLSGGFSPDKNDRHEFEKTYKVPTFDSFEKMLQSVNPDMVCICSPTKHHFTQVIQSIDAGVSMIWLEKPPTSSVAQHDKLYDKLISKNSNCKILVSYQRRYSLQYRKLKQIYEEQKLGECRSAHVNYSKGIEMNGSHMLDSIFYVFGDDSHYILQYVSTHKELDNPSFIITLNNNVDVSVNGDDLPYHNLDISLTFENGRVSILHGGMTSMFEIKSEHEFFPGFFRLKRIDLKCLDHSNSVSYMQLALSDLISSFEKNEEPISNLRSSRIVQQLIEDVRSNILQNG